MAKIIALFNNKGGVSKTTTTFHLGWKLAELGYKTLMIDTDPQCNLTGLCLNADKENKLTQFYEANNYNIKSALSPVLNNEMRPIEESPSGPAFLLPRSSAVLSRSARASGG